jgi:hypothetical protein
MEGVNLFGKIVKEIKMKEYNQIKLRHLNLENVALGDKGI